MRKAKPALVAASLVMAILLASALAGCGGTDAKKETSTQPQSNLSGNLSLSGSTTVLPIAQEAAAQFMKKNPNVTVTVQGGGSSVGITNVSDGVVNIGDSSRDLKPEEQTKGLVDHKIAYDLIAIITNPNVTGVTNLSADQAKGIFTGAITNWSRVGGPSAPITVVIRDSASGTREMFDEKVLGSTKDKPVASATGAIESNSNGIMKQNVASTPNSIGYISFGYLDKTVNPVSFNGVSPTLAHAFDKTYVLTRYLHMFTKGEGTGLAKAYIDFVLSPSFQNTTVSKEYIPMTKVPKGTT